MRVAAFLLIASLSFAQDNHKFFDKTAAFTLTGSAAVFTTDAVITCSKLGPAWRESFLPTQSCAGVAAFLGSDLAAEVGAAYFLHRHGHHRMERFVEMFSATGSGIGIAWTLSGKFHSVAPVDTAAIVIPVHSNPTFCIVGTPGC